MTVFQGQTLRLIGRIIEAACVLGFFVLLTGRVVVPETFPFAV